MRPLLLTMIAVALPAAAPFNGAAKVADSELAAMRGGVLLPNGMDVSVGIAIETLVDGQLALRTQVSTEDGVRIFSGGTSLMPPVAGGGVASPPTVRVDQGGTGTVISPTLMLPNLNVAVSQQPVTATATGSEVSATPNGDPVDTAFGTVRLQQGAGGSVVVLAGPTLELRHLVGAATGVLVANTADNRVIDTVATVSVQLNTALPVAASGALRLDAIATDAAIARNPF